MAYFRKLPLLGAVVFFLSCAAWGGWRACQTNFRTPALRPTDNAVDPPDTVFDFGVRPTGTSVEHVFHVPNKGDRPLEIIRARPGCGCMHVQLGKTIIEPGGSVPLNVTVSLKNLRGPVEQHLVVELNDSAQRFLLLKTKGLVESAFNVTPHAIDFGKVVQGQELEGCVDITATGPGPFLLQDVACDSPLCRIKQETVEQGRSYRVSVRTTGKLPPGSWRAALTIRTDNPKESQIDVPVVARVEGRPATPKEK